MRRTNWKTVSTLITMIAVAGCSDSAVAPKQASSTTDVLFAPGNRPTLSLHSSEGERTSSSFTVGPQGGIFFVGTNAVVFPKGSICEPTSAASGYQAEAWDSSCTPLKSPITVQYETNVIGGRTAVDFKTPLRFVPTTDANRYVWIYMYTPAAMQASDLTPFTILYAPTLGGTAFDESTGDASMRTYVDTRTGVSIRRIKHFSGYNSWGASCDPTVPDACPTAPPVGAPAP